MRKSKSFLARDRSYEDDYESRKFCSAWAAGALVVSSVMASDAAGDAADAQARGLESNAAASQAIADTQAKTAAEYLAFQKEQYADMKPLTEAVSQAQLDAMEQQAGIADANEARAAEYSAYEKETFRPLEESLVADAENFDTDAKREELARQGIADVSTAYEAQRKQALDTLSRYGVNPNSNRFAAMNMQLGQAEAADKAGAATNATTNAEQLAYTRKIDAASLGRGLAANASTAYGIATSAGNSSVNSGTAAINSAGSAASTLGSAYGQTSDMYSGASSSNRNAGAMYGAGLNYAAGQQATADSALSGLVGMGIKGAAGYASGGTAGMYKAFMADGGEVHEGKGRVKGIGGPVEDSVDAKLSVGEYVIPADTAEKIGIKRLDKLVAKTHTPAAVQRRTALKGA